MAKTLRGAPIVGYYKPDKEDFSDHGEEITIDGDLFFRTQFECLANFALKIALMRFGGHEVIMSLDDIICEL